METILHKHIKHLSNGGGITNKPASGIDIGFLNNLKRMTKDMIISDLSAKAFTNKNKRGIYFDKKVDGTSEIYMSDGRGGFTKITDPKKINTVNHYVKEYHPEFTGGLTYDTANINWAVVDGKKENWKEHIGKKEDGGKINKIRAVIKLVEADDIDDEVSDSDDDEFFFNKEKINSILSKVRTDDSDYIDAAYEFINSNSVPFLHNLRIDPSNKDFQKLSYVTVKDDDGDDIYIIFPTYVEKDGKIIDLSDDENKALTIAVKNENFIKVNDEGFANWFVNGNFKKAIR